MGGCEKRKWTWRHLVLYERLTLTYRDANGHDKREILPEKGITEHGEAGS